MCDDNKEHHQRKIQVGNRLDVFAQGAMQLLPIILQFGKDWKRHLVDDSGEGSCRHFLQFFRLIVVSQITGCKHLSNDQTLNIHINCLH